MLLGLFERIVNSNGINPRDTGLHLHLAVVDAGFIVCKQARQMRPCDAPIEPKLVAGEAYEHGAHAKCDPPFRDEVAHAGIDKGKTRSPICPGLKMRGIMRGFAQIFKGGMHAMRLNFWLVFNLLNEMTSPG